MKCMTRDRSGRHEILLSINCNFSMCCGNYIEVCDWFTYNTVLVVVSLLFELSDYKLSDFKLSDYMIGSQLIVNNT